MTTGISPGLMGVVIRHHSRKLGARFVHPALENSDTKTVVDIM